MNNIECMINDFTEIKGYAENYLRYISELIKKVDTNAIASFVEELEKARKNENITFFIGNGGSAATASHMANDFGIGSCVAQNEKPYRVLALTDNMAKMTAIANDYGYDKVFVEQLKMHYKPGDKLVAISASGNSANIIAAAEWVKKRKGTVIGLVGFDGGKLKYICDIVIHIATRKGEYGPVEDVHAILGHLIYTWLRSKKGKHE